AMEQVVGGLEAHQHAEFALEDSLDVSASEGADAVLGTRRFAQASLQAGVVRRIEQGWAPAPRPLVNGFDPTDVVASDPLLAGLERAAQSIGDVLSGSSLLGQDDGLGAAPDPLLGEGSGELLEFFQALVVGDEHR